MSRFGAIDSAYLSKNLTSDVFSRVSVMKSESGDYVNFWANPSFEKYLKRSRDIYVLVDISGGVRDMFRETALLTRKPSPMQSILLNLVNQICPAAPNGFSLIFYSDEVVQSGTVTDEAGALKLLGSALSKQGSFRGSKPVCGLERVMDKYILFERPSVAFMITDGSADNDAVHLRRYYESVLHKKFKTRDKFFCPVIEYGNSPEDGFSGLQGLYQPLGGSEDLFEVYQVSKEDVSTTLSQAIGMFVASEFEATLSVSKGSILAVNEKPVFTPAPTVRATISRMTSIQVKAEGSYTLTVTPNGFDPTQLSVMKESQT